MLPGQHLPAWVSCEQGASSCTRGSSACATSGALSALRRVTFGEGRSSWCPVSASQRLHFSVLALTELLAAVFSPVSLFSAPLPSSRTHASRGCCLLEPLRPFRASHTQGPGALSWCVGQLPLRGFNHGKEIGCATSFGSKEWCSVTAVAGDCCSLKSIAGRGAASWCPLLMALSWGEAELLRVPASAAALTQHLHVPAAAGLSLPKVWTA